MLFFYGADKIIENPIYNYGNPSNDYGVGLYLTPDKEKARLWATQYDNDGYINIYNVDLSGLKILKLDSCSKEDVLIWINILIQHRFSYKERIKHKDRLEKLDKLYHVDLDNYDVIIGYRADDSYFNYSRDFIDDDLSFEILTEAMRLGKLGIQIMLKSQKAFNRIEFVKASLEYSNFREEVLKEYNRIKSGDNDNNTFIRDILREKK